MCWLTGPDTDRKNQARRSSCNYDCRMERVCLVPRWLWEIIVLSVASLGGFIYDFKLKLTRSRGTERNVVFVLSLVDQVVRILIPYEACSRSMNEFTVYNMLVKYTNNLVHMHYRPCNEYQAVFPLPLARSIIEKNGLGTRIYTIYYVCNCLGHQQLSA